MNYVLDMEHVMKQYLKETRFNLEVTYNLYDFKRERIVQIIDKYRNLFTEGTDEDLKVYLVNKLKSNINTPEYKIEVAILYEDVVKNAIYYHLWDITQLNSFDRYFTTNIENGILALKPYRIKKSIDLSDLGKFL